MGGDTETPAFLYEAGSAQDPALGITFYGAVDDESAAAFEDALRHIERRTGPDVPVPVFLASTGGDIYAALKIIDLMDASHLTLDTVAVGACMSAAALIFAHGRRRFVGPRATIMLHGVRVDAFDGKLQDVEVEANEVVFRSWGGSHSSRWPRPVY